MSSIPDKNETAKGQNIHNNPESANANKKTFFQLFLSFLRLMTGLFLYAFGICMCIQANAGLAPWDLFHTGVSMHTGLSIGQANILFSVIIVVLVAFWLKMKVGLGTLMNMVSIGAFCDVILLNRLIPQMNNLFAGILMMLGGIFCIAFAMILYIGVGWGSGPRDSLFVGLAKKFDKTPRLTRTCVEVSVFVVGFCLGAKAGAGTILFALAAGPISQFVFSLLHFDIKGVQHQYLDDWFKDYAKNKLQNKEQKQNCSQSN